MAKPKPWRTNVGALIGLVFGAVIWWSAYEPDAGLLQKPQLLIVPVALGISMVIARNKLKQVGQFDPKIQTRNRRGRL